MKSVLVLRSSALGDFIIANPAFVEVRKAFPGCRVVFLTMQSADKVQQLKVANYAGDMRQVPWVDLAMPHLIDEVISLESLTNFRYLWRLRRRLRGHSFDAVIMMLDPCAPWLGRLKKLLLLNFLVGPIPMYGWRAKGPLITGLMKECTVSQNEKKRHHVHGALQFLSEMTPDKQYLDEELVFDLRPGQDAEDWASLFIQKSQLTECNRLIAVAPGSLQPHKRWPLESFKHLLSSLIDECDDAHFFIIGTPADKDIGVELAEIAPQKIQNLAGVTSISQSAALLKKCHLLVGNDGGAMHLGDAMGCKVVSIVSGIEYPNSIEPWHNKNLAIRWPVACAPCYSFVSCPEGHNKCMNLIPAPLVLEKCLSVL